MNTAHQWPQEIGLVKPMEEMISNNTSCSTRSIGTTGERKLRPQKEHALNCPRCNSANTKFCYYNNYSLTQPRYFCKTCRRYWTEGGSLRNVPVGGGSRKNKRSSSSSATSKKQLSDLTPPITNSMQNPNIIDQGRDLNLGFAIADQPYSTMCEFVELPGIGSNLNNNTSPTTTTATTTTSSLSALELLGSGITSRGLNSFMPIPITHDSNTAYSSGYALQDIKPPTLNFGLDGLGSGGYGSIQGVHHQESGGGGRPLFPIEDLRQVPSTSEFEQNRAQGESTGYWTGILGGGSW
ncbi:hypothetical protein Syun_031392 [Stephania yunnanensis]|uniref:Dof zinc finger protein n=1 Tax=Stephania yunnanensis TaxID=152371 RepID=A0AAP0HBT0_9MAGN